MVGHTLDAATRAVIAREGAEWVALAFSGGVSIVVGRSRKAGPLAKMLKERGYSVRFEFTWHRIHTTGASNEPAPAGWMANAAGH